MRHYGFELENEVFWRGLENGWEHVSISLWTKLVKEANVILDVGANTGIYSLIAKSVNPDSRVYAFEPVERVFEKLEFNNRLNDFDIICFDQALSDTDGEAIIYDVPSEHVYSVTVNKNINTLDATVIPTKIKIMKLDTFIERIKIERVDLIKIDVETHQVRRARRSRRMAFRRRCRVGANKAFAEQARQLARENFRILGKRFADYFQRRHRRFGQAD